uniref:Fe2OG dioxygenase domain-containing protein n=2 Tax=Gasterosteus aculeatus aculeatus TaxID=481459 RepID=G3NUJ5_GASAC|nr:2-oxoglutarate-Fe(II) type oxidoreductase ppzD isoform X1 [Gasterosteus aculeatus aculeatus]
MSIPVVDFAACSLRERDVADGQMHHLREQLESAFTKVGFVFLENTGITQEEVDRVMDVYKTFFLQPDEEKEPFSRKSFANNPNHGWVRLEVERLNPRLPGDLKESFNVTSTRPDIKWPSGAGEGFQEIQTSFFQRCNQLSVRVLRVMALSLGLDPEVFLSAHRLIGAEGNSTTLRSLYYPSVDHDKVEEGQLRCGEHSDYGSITLLFSSSGGLQVRRRSGEFIDVPSFPGAVLVNVADLMQRWTGDHFVSVVHRVMLPPAGDSSTRQSLAFFVQPDDDAVITCCDGSNKYPPVTGGGYLQERFKASYGAK